MTDKFFSDLREINESLQAQNRQMDAVIEALQAISKTAEHLCDHVGSISDSLETAVQALPSEEG
jgi:hypothetical protein